MATIGIIPARGGSKRLPGKNIIPFCGRPLLGWTVIQLRACKLVDRVYVSTDSDEIARVADLYGAIVHMREDPEESNDIVGGGVPIGKVVEKYCDIEDSVMTPFCTGPLRLPGDFDKLISKHYEVGRKTVISQSRLKEVVIQKVISVDVMKPYLIYKEPRPWEPELDRYIDGNCTVGNVVSVREYMRLLKVTGGMDPHGMIINRRIGPMYFILFDRWQNHDIDTQDDFDICEYLFMKHNLQEVWNEYWERLRA